MGWQRRQLNQQWGISWLTRGMSEMLTAWSLLQISVKHSSISILPTIGSTFTLLCGSVCTFTPGSLYYMCRPVLLCACTTSENKGCCLMSAVVFSTEIAYLCKFWATFYKKLCIVQLYAAGLWGDRMIRCALTLWLTIWLIYRKKKKIQLWNMTAELLALWLFFFLVWAHWFYVLRTYIFQIIQANFNIMQKDIMISWLNTKFMFLNDGFIY